MLGLVEQGFNDEPTGTVTDSRAGWTWTVWSVWWVLGEGMIRKPMECLAGSFILEWGSEAVTLALRYEHSDG